MGSPGSPERALLAVTPRGRLEPDLLHVFSGDHGALLFKAESQVTMLGVESYKRRFSERKVVLDGGSGKALLTARARGWLWRRHWSIVDHLGDPVMEVTFSRLWWRRRKHGKGPARYTFKAYEPHFSRPCIVAAPEHGRLVLRTAGRTPGQPGDALCEAAYGKVQLQLAGAPSPVALASDGGLSAAMAPRADQPLCSLLLAIYRGLLSARALAPPRGPAARLPAVAE